MTSPARHVAWLSVGLLLAGCATAPEPVVVTPASYSQARDRMGRTVGLLRRMAVLFVRQAPPPTCLPSGVEGAGFFPPPDELSEQLLAERRGYEVVVPDAVRYAPWLDVPANAPLMAELLRWGEQPTQAETGPALAALLARLRADDRVDGLLLLHTRPNCLNANPGIRTFMNIATLGQGSPHAKDDPRRTFETYRAWIVDTGSGRVVWHHALTAPGRFSLSGLFGSGDKRSDLEWLFEGLEDAVPKILTR